MLIIALLVVLLLGVFAIYKTLYAVNKKLAILDEAGVTKIHDKQAAKDNPYKDVEDAIHKKVKDHLSYSRLEQMLTAYHDMPTHKAFFISLDRDGRYAYGFAHTAPSTKDASKSAFYYCEEGRKKRKLTTICTPYLIDEHVAENLVE